MAGHFFAASCAYSMLPERNTKCRCTGEERLALAWPSLLQASYFRLAPGSRIVKKTKFSRAT